MKLSRRRFLHLALGATALPATSGFAWAQTYPTRPITIVVPFAVGGATDVIGRIVAERMRASLGQPIIIENLTGASASASAGAPAQPPMVTRWSSANGLLSSETALSMPFNTTC